MFVAIPTVDFFLKDVQDIDRRGKAHCVNSAKCVPPMIADNFDYTSITCPLERLDFAVATPTLCHKQCIAHFGLYLFGKFQEISLLVPTQTRIFSIGKTTSPTRLW